MKRRALVTGSAGFVGRHVERTLKERGWLVTGIDLKKGSDARLYCANSTQRFDLIVHAAAVVGGRETIDNAPIKVAYDFGLDSDVIQYAARTKPGRIVLISSSAAYPTYLQHRDRLIPMRLRESYIGLDKIVAPDAIYGLSKIALEAQGEKLRELGVPVTVVRPFSGYGADQDRDYPFPSFLDRAERRDDPFIIWGDGTQTRDFIHIDDFVNQMLLLADEGIDGPINLCTGRATSFTELAKLMCAEVGYSPQFKYLPDKPVGVYYRVGDPTAISRILPAAISLEEGIAMSLKVNQLDRIAA